MRVAGVSLDDLFRKDGRVYRVVGLIDQPVVVLCPVSDALDDTRHVVIGTPMFDEYEHLVPKKDDGA